MKYRVTPKDGKWIIQKKADRKTMCKPFVEKKDAEIALENLIISEAKTIIKPSVEGLNFAFKSEYKAYAMARLAETGLGKLHTKKSMQSYWSDYAQRIEPHMPEVSLSDFNVVVLEEFLLNCHKAGFSYRTLSRTCRNIRTFLRRMSLEEKNPNLSTLNFKIECFGPILPEDHDARYERAVEVISDEQITKLFSNLLNQRDKDFKSALTFAIITCQFLFGLRRGEMQGLKKSHVDLENSYLHIRGSWLSHENRYVNRTKNRGSRRSIELDATAKKFFVYWLDYLKQHHPYNNYLFPSSRGSGPVATAHISDLIWSCYAANGLAKIHYKGGHVVVDESPFKFAPLKTFRHRVATQLIDAMSSNPELTANYVKSVVGHTRFETTRDRYGNHNLIRSKTLDVRLEQKSKALNTNIISKLI
jgi:integrase